jgi:hypothetical protein
MSEVGIFCPMCRYYFSEKGRHRPEQKEWPSYEFCAAFPDGDGIPLRVFLDGHFKPKIGDHGIRFEPAEGFAIPPKELEWMKMICHKEVEEVEPDHATAVI